MKVNRLTLIASMITKFGLGFLLIGLLLFLSAGRIAYRNGWIFIAALAAPMLLFGVFLLIKNPAALERRLKSKEPDKKQRANIAVSGLMFLIMFALSGVDYRFGWSKMHFAITTTALMIMLIGYGMFAAVIMQNAYASRVVDVHDGQKVVTTGLYSIIRHPMYLATLFVFLPMPLILGSWFALIPMLASPLMLVRRIKNEEALLSDELDGYCEYMKKVKYRLLPFIW